MKSSPVPNHTNTAPHKHNTVYKFLNPYFKYLVRRIVTSALVCVGEQWLWLPLAVGEARNIAALPRMFMTQALKKRNPLNNFVERSDTQTFKAAARFPE